MIALGLDEVAALCPGRLQTAPGARAVTGVLIDSRRVAGGELFVAVGRGEEFSEDALARGAAAVVGPDDAFAARAALGGGGPRPGAAPGGGAAGAEGQ